MTLPSLEKKPDRCEKDDGAIGTTESGIPEAARSVAPDAPSSSRRFQTANDLDGLRRQLAMPRTPLLPSMDMFHSHSTSAQKSIVDTLPPAESVPPPAPYPSEAPPPRPSVVPPVRQPRREGAGVVYPGAGRASNPPPAPLPVAHLRPSYVPPPSSAPSGSVPPQARHGSNPPPGISRSDPPPRLSSVPPQPSIRGVRHHAGATPSADALRREAPTIPADSQSPSSPPPYDPSQPIPSLRVPSFAPPSYGKGTSRENENQRIGGAALVLLVCLLVVAGAVMGVTYAARTRSNVVRGAASAREFHRQTPPAVRVERVQPNAVVAPQSATDPTQEAKPTSVGTTAETASAPQTRPQPSSPSVAKPRAPSSRTNEKGSRKRLDPKSIDTETPLIMD